MKSNEKIQLGHGSGGRLMHRLIDEVFLSAFGSEGDGDDAAICDIAPTSKIALTTDSFVVQPIFFPGGDIGKLAVCGTVNDIAVTGATPKYLTTGFIIEEGFPIDDLKTIVNSMAEAAREAGVSIVAGDTKIVGYGAADKLFINTAGVGVFERPITRRTIESGDAILINGPIADHGIAVMLQREGLRFSSDIISDCAPLNGLVDMIVELCPDAKFIRDATRGGVAAVLNEIASISGLTLELDESEIPINVDVAAACEILGLEPLNVANEGKIIVIAPKEQLVEALGNIGEHKYGNGAGIIGDVIDGPGRVVGVGAAGSRRIIEMPLADQLPRIC